MVVDASALLEVLLRSASALPLEELMFGTAGTLHAPHLVDIEAAQVIRRLAASGAVSAEDGAAALSDLADFPLQRYPHAFLLPGIWELRHTITAYDAAYVALAQLLDMPLLTCDRKLARAASGLVNVQTV
jgi:predicted nucleic acid-binding protein